MNDQIDPVEHFIEQMGLIFQTDGVPRIAGRVFGLLLIDGGPLTLQDMAERLNISKASASTNARLLAQRGIIRPHSQSGDRQDYYQLVPDAYQHMLDEVSQRMRQNAQWIGETQKLLPDEKDGAKQRVGQLIRFYEVSAAFLEDWSERWKKEVTAPVRTTIDPLTNDAERYTDER